MKIKRSAIVLTLVAMVLALLVIVPTVILPTVAATTVNTFLDQSFENYTGSLAPSKASIVNNNGNKVIKLETTPATDMSTTCTPYVIYDGVQYTVSNDAVTVNDTSYPVSNGQVNIEGKVCTVYDKEWYWASYGSSDKNVDKNIFLSNTEASYVNEDKVYLQSEYYISADAKGSVQSQIYSFSYLDAATSARKDGTWLTMFYLVLDSGEIKTDGNSATTGGVLTKGAWNTVTVVFDLDSGAREIYVNNRYILTDNSSVEAGRSNFILKSNSWIVAKLNKLSTSHDYAGFIYIDDARIKTCTSEDLCAPAATDNSGNPLAYIDVTTSTGRELPVPYEDASTKFFTPYATVSPVYFDIAARREVVAPVKGASIRLTNAAGIRFATQLDLDAMKELLALEERGMVADVAIGTVIAPRQYVEAAGAFTMEALDANLSYAGSKYLNVKGTVGAYYTKLLGASLDAGYDTYFVGSIANVKLGNRDKDFSAVGYVKVDLHSGESVYLYSYDYASSTIANYSRNVKGIAATALADSNASWTEAQRVTLMGFSNGASTLSLSSSSVIHDVQYTANELFFRNAAGVFCRLTYEGVNGWRLQANGTSYDGFDETGAGQALSLYLGESVVDRTEKLVITTDDSKVTVTTPASGTYVTLNYTGSFNMQFYTAKGTVVSNVNSVAVAEITNNVADNAVTLQGSLASGEAVYGGGERFDVVNQRGNAFTLYTQDGWDKAETSYMAIPLFTTSRGAGMFINRYEWMSVDFGKASSSTWSVTINNDLIDCYFYATGKMTDALLGYTEISGHASLPEEWAQGELICRYSPDMRNFEDSVEYTSSFTYPNLYSNNYDTYGVKATGYAAYTDIPDYTNYYVKSRYSSSYKQAASSGMTLYNTDTLYTDNTGSAVAFTKVNNKYYAQGKTWATLSEADAFGAQYYDYAYLYRVTFTDGVATSLNTGSYAQAYFKQTDGTYRKLGAKGNIGGYGVKTIVENLINAGMKPTAMVMEPFGWSNISTNSTKYDELKNTVIWLQERGIKSMFYMGVASIGKHMAGYKSEYQAWMNVSDTSGNVVARTYLLPKTSGTGTNPDVGSAATQQYLDITNPEAVDWYMNDIWGMMIDLGADGIKIDFCECMPDEGTYANYTYTDANGVEQTLDEALLTYDWYDPSVFEGDDVHHGYSSYFISLFYKSMLEQKAAKNIPDGFCVLSRGGGIGSQRNPYLWEGDQTRTFEKIEDQLIALINSGISGVSFMTYDMAGYAYTSSGDRTTGAMSLEKESEIFARAIEYTAFTSNIQTHGDVRQAYEMNDTTKEIYKNYTELHELLIPYIQKYSRVACATGVPVVRHLVLQYQDDANVYGLETQYMFGDSLLVAPITEEGVTSKDVYLPAGNWLNLLTNETVTGGKTVTVSASISQIPVFMNLDCDQEDQNFIGAAFNGAQWKSISGKQLNIEIVPLSGDPYVEDPFVD